MSQIYEALRQMEKEQEQRLGTSALPRPPELLPESIAQQTDLNGVLNGALGSITLKVRPAPGLVSLTEPKSLGAEKFRALATRLEFLRRQNKMRSLQVTSSTNNEGKTFVAANLAITLAKYSCPRVLLLEGDLHRPSIGGLLGQSDLRGISDWWSNRDQDLERFVLRFDGTSLWFLGAGTGAEQPSEILQSTQFVEAFKRLSGWFDWIVVDSTPMLSVSDANLWSRLVDGTLLVVREGVASVKALQRGLKSLDNLKLIGAVMNGASECDLTGYGYNYHSLVRSGDQETKR